MHHLTLFRSHPTLFRLTSAEDDRIWLHFINDSGGLLLASYGDEIMHYYLVRPWQTLGDPLQVLDLVWVTDETRDSP
ncbi:hypothetical protein HG531_001964 [Fusarium graminearum]|nr:hypothetical protein HG531_001964 [Fusarium graminearum]